MKKGSILITAPSLDTRFNVSGISSVASFIIKNNPLYHYEHFELGRKDNEKRGVAWLLKMFQTTFRWIFVVSSGRISLVHFNFAFSRASVLRDAPLIMYAKLIQKKVVIHVHGGEYLLKTAPPAWMSILLKGVFSSKTPVLVLSQLEKNVLTEFFKISNIRILPNCVDLTVARQVNREYAAKTIPKLLFLGRIHSDKGIEYIYKALVLLKNQGIPFSFFMAGTGPQENEYVEKFTSLLGNDFTFCGVVSGEVKDSLLADCTIFLLPSLYEGLPMALLESMSFGMVPIVTDIGSIGYVVKNGENGIMLGKEPIAEIAKSVETLGNDSNMMAMLSANAREYIFSHFDPKKYIVSLNEIYDIA